jgi:cobalt-precorrin-5B (C1)-methyltransferase
MMGDHVGYALHAAAARGFSGVVLAGQFAKLLKIACGHAQTHVASSELDLHTLAAWLQEDAALAGLAPRAAAANTAREVLENSCCDARLVALVAARAQRCAAALAPGVEIKVLLAGYGGEVLYFR